MGVNMTMGMTMGMGFHQRQRLKSVQEQLEKLKVFLESGNSDFSTAVASTDEDDEEEEEEDDDDDDDDDEEEQQQQQQAEADVVHKRSQLKRGRTGPMIPEDSIANKRLKMLVNMLVS